MGFLVAQSGLYGGVDDQACHITVLRRRRAVDQFHRLHGIERELVGKDLGLLVGDRLAVHGNQGVRVLPERVEETVGVCHHPGGRVGDHLAQPKGRALNGQRHDHALIHIGMRHRSLLDEVVGPGGYGHAGGDRGNLQGDLRPHKKPRPHLDILHGRLKALMRHGEVVRVEWDNIECEFAGSAGRGDAPVS